MNDNPDELIVNWDQIDIQLVSTGDCTMHRAGEKITQISNCDEKWKIVVFSASMSGEYLAPQLIFQGKATQCQLTVEFSQVLDACHFENHCLIMKAH